MQANGLIYGDTIKYLQVKKVVNKTRKLIKSIHKIYNEDVKNL